VRWLACGACRRTRLARRRRVGGRLWVVPSRGLPAVGSRGGKLAGVLVACGAVRVAGLGGGAGLVAGLGDLLDGRGAGEDDRARALAADPGEAEEAAEGGECAEAEHGAPPACEPG